MNSCTQLTNAQFELFESICATTADLLELDEKDVTAEFIQSRMLSLKRNWFKFEANHEIITKKWAQNLTEHRYFKQNLASLCENTVRRNQNLLNDILKRTLDGSGTLENVDQQDSPSKRDELRRPKKQVYFNIPKFDGSRENWPGFRLFFETLVDSSDAITDFMKFSYLRKSINEKTLQLIQNVPVTAENFELAWKIITEHYENLHRRK